MVRKTSIECTKRRNCRSKKVRGIDQSIKDLSQRTKNSQPLFPQFEYHYDRDVSDNLLHILTVIQTELASHSNIHDWDEKLHPDPVKSLALFAKQELGRWGFDRGSHIIAFSAIDRIITVNRIVHRQRVHPGSQDSKSYAFSHGIHEALPASIDGATSSPRLNYGRVM